MFSDILKLLLLLRIAMLNSFWPLQSATILGSYLHVNFRQGKVNIKISINYNNYRLSHSRVFFEVIRNT